MLRVACWQTDQSAEVRTSERQDDRSRMLGAPTEWRQLLTTQCARVDKLEGHLSQKGWPLDTQLRSGITHRSDAPPCNDRKAAAGCPCRGQLSRWSGRPISRGACDLITGTPSELTATPSPNSEANYCGDELPCWAVSASDHSTSARSVDPI